MTKVGSARSAASALAFLSKVAAVVGLWAAIAGAQEFAWPPSIPESEPHIDYTRKVLSCNDHGCGFIVVRSQEELLQALTGTSNPGQSNRQDQLSYVLRLILGGCFGGELPVSLVNEVLTISPEVEERIKAAVGHAPALNSGLNRPNAQLINVR